MLGLNNDRLTLCLDSKLGEKRNEGKGQRRKGKGRGRVKRECAHYLFGREGKEKEGN